MDSIDRRIEVIKKVVSNIPFVKQLCFIEQRELSVIGKVEIAFEGLQNSLEFEFTINPAYPLKTSGSESINFRNSDLIACRHVMADGSICVHTSHSIYLEEKLTIDFNSLKEWTIKYYINKEDDLNYEHIIVHDKPINDFSFAFHFTDCEEAFEKCEYGIVPFSLLQSGDYKDNNILNLLVQGFIPVGGEMRKCKWSSFYRGLSAIQNGVYCFIEDTPALHNKFVYSNWQELMPHLSTEFMEFLRNYQEVNKFVGDGVAIPFFVGYRINTREIHWQAALMRMGSFPIEGSPEKNYGRKTGKWITTFSDKNIPWALTRNVSYRYFFGRGTFSEEITSKKILVVGVGAIGSMVAQTLTRCGCNYIDIIDPDIKEPENVCRSEYRFSNGITNKTSELTRLLCEISPFLNTIPLHNYFFDELIKSLYESKSAKDGIVEALGNYDLIFDCSTDNDLMYVLSTLNLKTDIINISITNHARELVCAFHPNIYRFVNNQFSNVLQNDIDDLYEPTGCWSPTFKASYNDISTHVQFALNHINKIYDERRVKRNFIIKQYDNSLKIIEY